MKAFIIGYLLGFFLGMLMAILGISDLQQKIVELEKENEKLKGELFDLKNSLKCTISKDKIINKLKEILKGEDNEL